MFVLAEAGQECAPRLLERDGNFAIGEAGAQGVGPVGQCFRGLFQSRPLDDGAAGGAETQGVLLIAPVQANQGGIIGRRRWDCSGVVLSIHNYGCLHLGLRARWLGLSEGLRVESSNCRHLSIRFESKRRAGAKLWADSSSETGCLFVIQRGVTAGLVGLRQTCSQKFRARRAKLFTVGCGERWRRLSSPPVNNFGLSIRVASSEPVAKRQSVNVVLFSPGELRA